METLSVVIGQCSGSEKRIFKAYSCKAGSLLCTGNVAQSYKKERVGFKWGLVDHVKALFPALWPGWYTVMHREW